MIKYIPEDTLALYCGELSRWIGESSIINPDQRRYYFNINEATEISGEFDFIEEIHQGEYDSIDHIDQIEQEYGLPFRIKSDGLTLFSEDNNFYD